jgi:hypothetical protein
LNCGAGHIIAENHECLSRLMNNESHRLLRVSNRSFSSADIPPRSRDT